MISPAATSHELPLQPNGKTLRVFAENVFLDLPVKVDGGTEQRFEYSPPGKGKIEIRATRGECKATIGKTDLGFGPWKIFEAVAGTYQVTLVCPDGVNPVFQANVVQGLHRPGPIQVMAIRARSLVALAIAITIGVSLTAQSGEDLPRRQYESGLSFLKGQRYSEALKDFQAIIDSFPRSLVADNALLQVALYQIDVAQDLGSAQSAIDQLLKAYPETDSAPMAYVVGGRISMAKGRSASDVDSAVASFERVERLFPGNDAVPAAGFYAGEALRLVRRHEEALVRYRRVTASYPSSPWAARANLAAGYCLVQADRAPAALPEVQRVRQMMPASREAEAALNINSILYRLHVRAPKGPAFTFSGRFIGPDKSNFDDVIGVTVDPLNRILLGFNKGIAVFDAKGTLTSTVDRAGSIGVLR